MREGLQAGAVRLPHLHGVVLAGGGDDPARGAGHAVDQCRVPYQLRDARPVQGPHAQGEIVRTGHHLRGGESGPAQHRACSTQVG
eukprot:7895594-Pyramimonas_sp.AAC.1